MIDRSELASLIASRKLSPAMQAQAIAHLNFIDKIGDCPTAATAPPTPMNPPLIGQPNTLLLPAGYPAAVLAALKP